MVSSGANPVFPDLRLMCILRYGTDVKLYASPRLLRTFTKHIRASPEEGSKWPTCACIVFVSSARL